MWVTTYNITTCFCSLNLLHGRNAIYAYTYSRHNDPYGLIIVTSLPITTEIKMYICYKVLDGFSHLGLCGLTFTKTGGKTQAD